MDVSVDVLSLKSNVTGDYIMTYLEDYKKVCQRRRDAYTIHAAKLKYRHNIVTIPLLVLTSGTSVLAALELDRVIVTSLGASSAVLTAVQRFCAYAERSENASMISKGYSKIIRRIESLKMYLLSDSTSVNPNFFSKCIQEIQNDIDTMVEQAIDVPFQLITLINTVNGCVCFKKILGTGKTQPKIPDSFS